MKDQDITTWLDGELDADEQALLEQELRESPEHMPEIAALIREQLLMAETLNEASAPQSADCPECEAVEPSLEMLPNEEIFTAYVGGQLSKEEMAEVEEQIESDPVFKRELAEFCRQGFQMAEVLESKPTQSQRPVLNFPGSSHRQPDTATMTKPNRTPWLKIAAMIALLATGGWFLAQQYLTDPGLGPSETARVQLDARISELTGEVSVIRNDKRLQAMDQFKLCDGDRIVTGSGRTLIHYDDGTAIQLRSYSQLQFSHQAGAKRLNLERGMASADVASQPDGKPMSIKTSLLEIKVVGTSFLLEATPDQALLEMTEGSVAVTHIHTGKTSMATAGESITANRSGMTHSESKPRVVSFSLIDTETKEAVTGYDPIAPGSTIKLSNLQDRNLTIRANTIPKIVGEVNLSLKGPRGYPKLKQKENYYPYLLTINQTQSHWVDAKVYEAMPGLIPGTYTVTASATTSDGHESSLTLHFEVKP